MKRYFYSDSDITNGVMGPNTLEEIQKMVFENQLTEECQITEEGEEKWMKLSDAPLPMYYAHIETSQKNTVPKKLAGKHPVVFKVASAVGVFAALVIFILLVQGITSALWKPSRSSAPTSYHSSDYELPRLERKRIEEAKQILREAGARNGMRGEPDDDAARALLNLHKLRENGL